MDYGGDVSAKECWGLLRDAPDCVLVDVRTTAEWAYVGIPALEDGMKELVLQQWQVFPDMSVDPEFAIKLDQQLNKLGANKNTKLCFLCRSGVRSLAAARAMTATGYRNSYNVSNGFEGDLDKFGHRGSRNGWKADGLPWQQR
ncbi:MAG: rhodanese-like domain-containing protein [Rhizobiaceae bacterium]